MESSQDKGGNKVDVHAPVGGEGVIPVKTVLKGVAQFVKKNRSPRRAPPGSSASNPATSRPRSSFQSTTAAGFRTQTRASL
jgi:hypothetical protein